MGYNRHLLAQGPQAGAVFYVRGGGVWYRALAHPAAMAPSLIDMVPVVMKTWSTPRRLVIQDWRLGVLNVFLIILVLVLICVQLFINKMYALDHVPGGYVTFWFEPGPRGSRLDSGAVNYCNSSDYSYVYTNEAPLGSQYWNDMDIHCLAFPYGMLTEQVNQDQGFVVTYVKRERVKTTDCTGTAAASACDIPLLHSLKDNHY